jgi:hypothetical protein
VHGNSFDGVLALCTAHCIFAIAEFMVYVRVADNKHNIVAADGYLHTFQCSTGVNKRNVINVGLASGAQHQDRNLQSSNNA